MIQIIRVRPYVWDAKLRPEKAGRVAERREDDYPN